jgi:hypothetical protein
MIDRDEISDDIISGEAGCTWTRFEDGVDGPWSDFRRACCLVRVGIGGAAMLSIVSLVDQTVTPELERFVQGVLQASLKLESIW